MKVAADELTGEEVAANLIAIKKQITETCQKVGRTEEPRLVAVSKLKAAPLIKACVDVGHLYFGENYVQELLDKASQLPPEIRWHFVGHLQSNKCKLLAKLANMDTVETVDSLKLARELDKAFASHNPPLNIMVQVNTSDEASKSGVEPEECCELVQNILANCKRLKFVGLMTIGQLDHNPEIDFRCLTECRTEMCEKLSLQPSQVGLSMGMSGDYIKAIEEGSTNVRVGSSIFGHRH